ncbi:MAG: hypothetical protein ACREQT_00710 [Candidatus Binataceae bacterium]
MVFNQSNFGEILDSEREMVLRGEERFGAYYVNAVRFSELLARFIISARPDRMIFALFLSQVRKHHTLALFSTVRLHRIQAMMDLRQTLEAGACAAYAIANTDPADFADKDQDGILNPTQALARKRYKWLEQNFSEGSNAIKRIKEMINKSTAHSNIADAHLNFNFDAVNGHFDTPFFDFEDDYFVKTDLWLIANVAMGLMRLLLQVNSSFNVMVFADEFEARMKELSIENGRLRVEMMQTERYQKISTLLENRAARRSQP